MIRRRGKSPRPAHKVVPSNYPVIPDRSNVKRPKILIKGEAWPVLRVGEAAK